MTAGTLATIAVDPSTDREAASLAIRRAAVEGGLGWLAAARLATAAMELVGAAPAVVELVTLTAADGARLGVAVTGGTGSCAALPAGLVDTCTERVRPTGEVERVVAVSANPAVPDPAQAALCEALAGGLTTRHLLGHALATVERQARALAVADAERRELTSELDETSRGLLAVHDELQAANQRVADLVAMLSHDIRQPLSVVTSYCTLLLDGWNDLAHTELRELLRRIVAAGTGMTQLVEEILTLTQLDTEGLGTRPAAVDAHAAVVDAIAGMADAGSTTVDGEPGRLVLADPRHFHQILTNLLSNALKYGAPPVQVTVGGDEDVVDVDVRDHGEGVPAAFVPHLFDRFTRADTPACREKKGTGLGLYIVRQLAEANGGTITYRDHADGGGCFTVHLPTPPTGSA